MRTEDAVNARALMEDCVSMSLKIRMRQAETAVIKSWMAVYTAADIE